MAIDINVGSFIPSTYNIDVSNIYTLDVNSEAFKELIVNLYLAVNRINLNVNNRDAGYYDQTEFINGQLFFPNPSLNSNSTTTPEYRQVFRKVIDFGALPNATSKSVPHNIQMTSNYSFTRLYGAASDTLSLAYIQLPYASPVLANNIEVSANATQVTVTTGSNRTNFNTCYIVLEYIKQ